MTQLMPSKVGFQWNLKYGPYNLPGHQNVKRTKIVSFLFIFEISPLIFFSLRQLQINCLLLELEKAQIFSSI